MSLYEIKLTEEILDGNLHKYKKLMQYYNMPAFCISILKVQECIQP